ncbi:hypothetical protein [Natrarchaeobius halalkaliphilus]|nr:hypothetical protein [Natrarchaeobius halalkaliphilus]
MTTPSVPPNAGQIMGAVRRALRNVDVTPTEAMDILSWAQDELPAIYERDQTAYLVLGSYRSPYIRRVRSVSDRLNRRYGTYAFLIGDLDDIDVSRLPEFRVKFHLTAALADYITTVIEQDAGGEINELGKLSETEYFRKAYVLPRGYRWDTESNLRDREDVLAAAAQIETATGADEETKQSELSKLVDRATAAGIDVTVEGLTEWLVDHDLAVPSYSWVQLNDFRLFELQDRCCPWLTEDELVERTDELPGSPRPQWEE